MALVAKQRGKFQQLERDGGPVDIKVFSCKVVAAPYEVEGKRYARLDMTRIDPAERHLLANVESTIRRLASPRFSPLRDGLGSVVVKIPADASWEDARGDVGEFSLAAGDWVDVVVSPGAFGVFGWTLLVKRLKRSGPEE